MKKIKAALFILITLLSLSLLASCGGSDGGSGDNNDKTYRVMVSLSEGVSIEGENPVNVKPGEDAVFTVKVEEGYVYVSSEGAEYDSDTGKLTVKNVKRNTNINLVFKKADYDLNETYVYIFKPASSLDTSSIQGGGEIKAGTRIKLYAGDESRVFVGWTVGYKLIGGGEVISRSREFELTAEPKYLVDGVLTVYANYVDADKIYYDSNGGVINHSTPNMKSSAYYTTTVRSTTLEVKYGKDYLAYFECASGFYDDGTFTREGYVLTEYNTRPDGKGTSYSLGSKVPITTDGAITTLYCIWSEATPSSDFTYSDYTYSIPAGIVASNVPHWVENGIIITGYTGDAEKVVIPESIDGKYVIAIASGAFHNKKLETLVMGRHMLRVEDGAFTNCPYITTVYYPDGIYSMNDAAFDEASYTSFRNFYVNATTPPRFSGVDVGGLAVKLSRLLASENKNRVIVIAGSSSLMGLGSEYLEKLLDDSMRVINFGTTRTTHGALYLEAMSALAHEGDIIIYAPENSSYMFGERELYWKTFRDLEGMVNIYRYVDFSNYNGMFSSMTDLNQNYRFKNTPITYESICALGDLLNPNPTYDKPTTNKFGDYLNSKKGGLSSSYHHNTYYITMNERVKSRFEGDIYGSQQEANKDYTDMSNITWASIDDAYFTDIMNHAINRAKSGGAKVYFGFCPVDADYLVEGADSAEWLASYEELLLSIYDVDGLMGSASDFVFDHHYFYDSAFHLNDYGRTYRTYRLYLALAECLGIGDVKGLRDVGEDFDGCLFEFGATDSPLIEWSPK